MLVTPPFGASSNIALWRAYSKPPVELVVADLDDDKSCQTVGQSDQLHHKKDGDHRQYTREHSQNDGEAHKRLSGRKTHTAHSIGNHQDKGRRNDTAEHTDNHGVPEPRRKIDYRIRSEEKLSVVVY